MGRSKLLAMARSLTLLAGVGAPGLALAADLLPPPPPLPLPEPVEFGGGWYLRGDVGASIYDQPGYSSVDKVKATYYGGGAGTGFLVGVGAGYQFNNFFRADVTGEFRSTSLRTNSYSEYSYGGCDPYQGCYKVHGRSDNIVGGNYTAGVVLANAYVDLGTFYGVTPFIGGGVGAAFHKLSGFTDTGANKEYVTFEAGYGYPLGGSTGAGVFKDKSSTSLAWALHAGLAMDVTANFKMELAYRYLNLGHASTGVLNCFCGETLTPIKVKNLEAHEVRIGLRYLLGGFAAPAVAEYIPPAGPIVSKY